MYCQYGFCILLAQCQLNREMLQRYMRQNKSIVGEQWLTGSEFREGLMRGLSGLTACLPGAL